MAKDSMATMYAQTLDQCIAQLNAIGHKISILYQGHMGIGKSAMLTALMKDHPNHTACYFDMTTKDLGDLMLPIMKMDGEMDYVRFASNEELGIHLQNTPILLMVDEFGKGQRPVQNGLLRILHERKFGTRTLHPESIVFATTNLGAEGVGDIIQPHARNRVMIVNVKKPEHMEWIEWGISNGIDPTLLAWVRENPQVLQTFEDVPNPDDNEYIFHPKASTRTSFVTPRSLENASHYLKVRDQVDHTTLVSGLSGLIGARAALDLMAFVQLADQLPTLDSIKNTPMQAVIPKSPSAVCMVVYRTLSTIDKTWVDNWMDYMNRLDKEAQGLFVNGVRAKKYDPKKQSTVMSNKKFTQWAREHDYMFAADSK